MKKLVLTVAGLVDENSDRVLFEPVLRNAPRLVYYSDVQSLQAENDRLNASLAEAQAERDRLRLVAANAAAWEQAYAEVCRFYRKNKSRMWVLTILREHFEAARKALEGEGK